MKLHLQEKSQKQEVCLKHVLVSETDDRMHAKDIKYLNVETPNVSVVSKIYK